MLDKIENKSKNSMAFIFSIGMHFLLLAFLSKHNFYKQNNLSNLISTNGTALKVKKVDFTKVHVISRKKLEEIKKQIVSSEQTGKKVLPKKSHFSGESNQAFDRETIARTIAIFKEAGKGQRAGTIQSTALQELNPHKVLKEKSKESSQKRILSMSDFGKLAINFVKEEKMEVGKEEDSKEDKKGEMEMQVSQGIENGSLGKKGLAQNNDFIEDVPLGDVTNLNTTENKYFGFYHRIRQKLEQHWGGSIRERAKKLYKSGRRMPASENLITAVIVILNEKGNIVDIKIEGTSGIKELDQAAVESFNKAGPFPNPPKGLIVDGRATIQWGFVVKS